MACLLYVFVDTQDYTKSGRKSQTHLLPHNRNFYDENIDYKYK